MNKTSSLLKHSQQNNIFIVNTLSTIQLLHHDYNTNIETNLPQTSQESPKWTSLTIFHWLSDETSADLLVETTRIVWNNNNTIINFPFCSVANLKKHFLICINTLQQTLTVRDEIKSKIKRLEVPVVGEFEFMEVETTQDARQWERWNPAIAFLSHSFGLRNTQTSLHN